MTRDELESKIHEAIRTRQMDYDKAIDDDVEEIMDLFNSYEILTKNDFCHCEHNSNSLVLTTNVICSKCNKEVKIMRL